MQGTKGVECGRIAVFEPVCFATPTVVFSKANIECKPCGTVHSVGVLTHFPWFLISKAGSQIFILFLLNP